MPYNPEIHHRRSVRLQGYDYSQEGACFVTVCTQNRLALFGEIQHGEMILNDAGKMVSHQWQELMNRFDHIELHEFVIMPNHIHGILEITRRGEPCVRPSLHDRLSSHDHNQEKGEHEKKGEHTQKGEHKVRPYGTLPCSVGRIVQAFKSITTHEYIGGVKQSGWPPFSGKLWQRNYYEHIIRNEYSYLKIAEYVRTNPQRWEEDTCYV